MATKRKRRTTARRAAPRRTTKRRTTRRLSMTGARRRPMSRRPSASMLMETGKVLAGVTAGLIGGALLSAAVGKKFPDLDQHVRNGIIAAGGVGLAVMAPKARAIGIGLAAGAVSNSLSTVLAKNGLMNGGHWGGQVRELAPSERAKLRKALQEAHVMASSRGQVLNGNGYQVLNGEEYGYQ